MIAEDWYVRFLIKHNLTQSQFLFLYLLYKKRKDLIVMYKDAFPADDTSMIGEYLVNDLKRREFFEIDEQGNFKLGEKFLSLFINKYLAAEEIFNIYPKFIHKNGMDIPLTIMDKKSFAGIYYDAIYSSYEEHKEVLLDIEYAKENHLLIIDIEKFVKSHYWKTIRELRNGKEVKNEIVNNNEQEF